jgi:hypothetical protein
MNKISIGAIFGESYGLTFGNLGLFARVAAIPFALIMAMSLAVLFFAPPRPPGWMTTAQEILTFIIQVPLLTSWHRFTLLPRSQALPTMGFVFTLREVRFFGYLLLMTLSFSLPFFLLAAAVPMFGSGAAVVFFMAVVAVLLLWARLGLVFPACAVGDPVRLADSWQRTLGNGWRIFWLMILVSLPFAGVMLTLFMIFGSIVAATQNQATLGYMAIPMVFVAIMFAGISASTQAIVYREIVGYDPSRFRPA